MSLHEYIGKHYNELVRYASAFSSDPHDLVHESYVKAYEAGFTYINDYFTDAYFKRSIKNNSRKATVIFVELPEDIVEDVNISRIISREQMDLAVNSLDQFDKTIFNLYLSGVNMKQLADESGIASSTIYHALSRIRQTLKQHL